MDKTDVQKFLDAIDNLPSMPNIVVEVMNIANDPNSEIDDLVKIVQYDQAITANCLKICNSAMFGARQKIASLKDAVVYLGFKNLVKIVLASSSLEVFKVPSLGYGMKKGQLWRHSVSVSIFSQLICKKLDIDDDASIFTAALLHDVGKLALDSFVGKHSIGIMDLMEQGKTEFNAEREVIGVDHARIGGLVAKRWQFPTELVNSIQNHHTVTTGGNSDFIVRVSNVLSNIACGYHDGVVTTTHAQILNQLNFTQEDLEDVIRAFPVEMRKASDLLNL